MIYFVFLKSSFIKQMWKLWEWLEDPIVLVVSKLNWKGCRKISTLNALYYYYFH